MSEPLHERQPTTRFSDRAADYVKFRPTYPADAVDAILAGFGAGVCAADIGAGTGISARLLAERGVGVIAIEPNAAMREAGQRAILSVQEGGLSSHVQEGGLSSPRSDCGGRGLESPPPCGKKNGLESPPPCGKKNGLESPPPCDRGGSVEWREGSAEATGLGDGSVDLVLCAQSYHWFEPATACREFGRILRPGGRLALMWNDGDESDPVARGYYDLVREASTGAGPTSHQTVAKDPRVEPPFDGDRMQRLQFRNEQRLDVDGLIGRAMSASYVPKEGAKAERLVAGLRELHAEHVEGDGCVGFVYGVWVYLCEVLIEPFGDRGK